MRLAVHRPAPGVIGCIGADSAAKQKAFDKPEQVHDRRARRTAAPVCAYTAPTGTPRGGVSHDLIADNHQETRAAG